MRRPIPRRRRQSVHQQLQQRRLASAVLTHDADARPEQMEKCKNIGHDFEFPAKTIEQFDTLLHMPLLLFLNIQGTSVTLKLVGIGKSVTVADCQSNR